MAGLVALKLIVAPAGRTFPGSVLPGKMVGAASRMVRRSVLGLLMKSVPSTHLSSLSVLAGVAVGSRIIQELENTPPAQAVDAVQRFVAGIRTALDERAS